jgi:hypothetical protein
VKREEHAPEYERFDNLMQKLIKVPHGVLKAKLDAEKRAKKRKKPRTSSASRAADVKD